jgi:predicted helicase
MTITDREQLRGIKTFPSLVRYLRDELDWPIEAEDFDALSFDYEPEELGLDVRTAAKIEYIKQLRPLRGNQPWGIFFIKFEPKRLPVVVLRRILRSLVIKKRQSANRAEQATWNMNDLLFISAYGENDERQITFSHFADSLKTSGLPTLRVLGWDDADTALHLDYVHDELHKKLRWPEDLADLVNWSETWSSAFTIHHREVINTSKQLALRLAELARVIRKRVNAILAVESDKGPLRKLMAGFKDALIHDLSEENFADMYAQTIAYGLLAARVANPTGGNADDFMEQMPLTNPFLKELMETFINVGRREGKMRSDAAMDFDELGVREVVDLLDDANMEAVLRDFGDRNPQEDPVIHFYELFLKEYDPKERVKKGIFYTPQPVVSFIVRSVDEVLRTEFGLMDGLADTTTWEEMARRNKGLIIPEGITLEQAFVQILDPAVGTGTFLVEVINLIHKTMVSKWKSQGCGEKDIETLWNKYVSKHLLPRLHGFELLMAPYAIAHMKIGLKLYETGYRFGGNERARIYLTNTLEPPQEFSDRLAFAIPALAHEAEAVNEIKQDQVFTVVIGNPPYRVYSENKTAFIDSLMNTYKQIKGKLIKEVRVAPLMDDYCKFIRYSDHMIERSGNGVIGMITNHSYLSGPVFRGMRFNLSDRYWIEVLDLHGNYYRGDSSLGDINIFDIKPGVCISLMIKAPSGKKGKYVHYDQMRGKDDSKLQSLLTYKRLCGRNVNTVAPFFYFTPQSGEGEEYLSFQAVTDIFKVGTLGMMTGKDYFMISYTAEDMRSRICELINPDISSSALREKYQLVDSRDWVLEKARQIVFDEDCIEKVFYRPFDKRFTYFDKKALASPQSLVNKPLRNNNNIALCVPRQLASLPFRHALVSDCVTEMSFISNRTREANRLFPLYIFDEGDNLSLLTQGKQLNLSTDFLTCFAAALSLRSNSVNRLPQDTTAELLFGYIYAILHSEKYRRRYAEYLMNDFPRIPLTSCMDMFRELANLGTELVALHILKSHKLDEYITNLVGPCDFQLDKVSYSEETVWIDKAKMCGFQGVPEEVWEFHIGGYQVCYKWLKDRKGRTLSKDDIEHYQKIVVALNETIRIMREIDEVIDKHGGWPDAFLSG